MDFNICRPGILTLEQLAICLQQLPIPSFCNRDDKRICYLPKYLQQPIVEDVELLEAPPENIELIPYSFKLVVITDKEDREDSGKWAKVWQYEGDVIINYV